MKNNPIQFAVVREDSLLEENLVRDYAPKQILMIASGGCTALNLIAQFPELKITLLDPNAAQLNLVKKKIKALTTPSLQKELKIRFNIETTDSSQLAQCGNFESLFRSLKSFIYEMIAEQKKWEEFFKGDSDKKFLESVFSNPYWPVGFQLFFSNELLIAMFGPAAVQHAAPGSYPNYFQKVFEKGLQNQNALSNYFLHHILLGKYIDRKDALPNYLQLLPDTISFNYIHGYLGEVPSLIPYDFINLSNILDWMSKNEVRELLTRIKIEAIPGTLLIWRQLNNPSDFTPLLAPEFEFDETRAQKALQEDRSLFYSKICIGKKLG